MVDNLAVLLTLRQHLLGLQFAGTGVTSLTATGNGYTRATGSFVTDGFTPGMEVVPAGFADNTPGIIQSVQPLALTLTKARPPEAEAAGRSLTVGIPPIQGWENVNMVPLDDRWYIEEDYLPGPTVRVGMSPGGLLHHEPMYVLRIAGLAGRGVTALSRVADGVLAHFYPGLALALPDGNQLRVRSEPAPFRGQVLPSEAGRAEVVISIPLWLRTSSPS